MKRPTTTLTVALTRGRVGGAAILTLFGAAWSMIALLNWSARPSWSVPAASSTAVALLMLCVIQLVGTRNSPRLGDPVAAAKGKRAGMLFGIIFGIEGGLIGLSSGLLASRGHSDWIPIAAGVIVGLHFLPLAHLFEVPLYYWTGALCVLGLVVCSFVPDTAARQLLAGLVMAAVLWTTVVVLLMQTRALQPARASG